MLDPGLGVWLMMKEQFVPIFSHSVLHILKHFEIVPYKQFKVVSETALSCYKHLLQQVCFRHHQSL